MKKNIIWIVGCAAIGIIMGKVMFDQYDQEKNTPVSGTTTQANVYFFQVGVYSSLENMKNASIQYEDSIYREQDSKYYLFVGLTKSEENREKLKTYFESLYQNIYIKEISLTNSGFLDTLDQYDLLLKEAKTNQEIKEVNKSILAKYEEMI